jgi:hypothetical protein
VTSIMRAYDLSRGLPFLKDVVKLETTEYYDVLIRSITEEFWRACIDTVDTKNMRLRVCAVGTPGIGKTSTTPILIRMLLNSGKTVVYLLRTEEKVGWYYEFKPSSTSTHTNPTTATDAAHVQISVDPEGTPALDHANKYEVSVYSEKIDRTKIESLQNSSTYYVVDPGRTKSNCNPENAFKAKVIIVSSPDSDHWGGTDFTKGRDSGGGLFKYYPLWSLDEMLLAHTTIIGEELFDEDDILERYRQFGGVPRHVFASKALFDTALREQDNALDLLTHEQVMAIVTGKMNPVEMPSIRLVKSAVLGIKVTDDEASDQFRQRKVIVISALVAEKIYSKFINILWSKMLDPGFDGPKIFEAYTRQLMAKSKNGSFEFRDALESVDAYKKVYKVLYLPIAFQWVFPTVALGGCTKIQLVQNPVESAKRNGSANVVFHSVDQRYPLIDFLYKDDKGHFHAFQATIGKKHTTNIATIERLGQQVGGANKLTVYYLVPAENFRSFVLDPTMIPKSKKAKSTKAAKVTSTKPRVLIVSIPNPGFI